MFQLSRIERTDLFIVELLKSIGDRKSIRAFKSKTVPKRTLLDILRTASRAPSGVNSQPWEFFIVRGTVLEQLKSACLSAHRSGEPKNPDIPVYRMKSIVPELDGVFNQRRVALGKQIFSLLGISKEDKEGQVKWVENMVRFYDAPAVIITAIDKTFKDYWPLLDIGFVSQNILLAAQEYGLGTCVMRAIVDYPILIRKIVGIPESKRIILGIAIGYADTSHPINSLITEREDVLRIVTFVE
ncbi:MAG: nitroreductase [Deltaproteobacteria bacterium]|nr:nitroreductase [Deltaproteobacteria bacterium]